MGKYNRLFFSIYSSKSYLMIRTKIVHHVIFKTIIFKSGEGKGTDPNMEVRFSILHAQDRISTATTLVQHHTEQSSHYNNARKRKNRHIN